MSITSRDLGGANIYNQMLEDEGCSIILVVAGSTSAGGCIDLYADLVRNAKQLLPAWPDRSRSTSAT